MLPRGGARLRRTTSSVYNVVEIYVLSSHMADHGHRTVPGELTSHEELTITRPTLASQSTGSTAESYPVVQMVFLFPGQTAHFRITLAEVPPSETASPITSPSMWPFHDCEETLTFNLDAGEARTFATELLGVSKKIVSQFPKALFGEDVCTLDLRP